jgi:hypothetical protein
VCSSMQAIRWRLIKSPPGAYRRQALTSLTDADVLCCADTHEASLVKSLLAHKHSGVTSELVRLLSAMASDSGGRTYLMQPGSHVVPELFQLLKQTPETRVRRLTGASCQVLLYAAWRAICSVPLIHWQAARCHDTAFDTARFLQDMHSTPSVDCTVLEFQVRAGDETRDTPVHQHTLALLQKLSLARPAQSDLIGRGMISWLVSFLQHAESLSELCLEYAMALLMNLCLRSAGRTAAEAVPVLELLDTYIQVRWQEQQTCDFKKNAVAEVCRDTLVCKVRRNPVPKSVVTRWYAKFVSHGCV